MIDEVVLVDEYDVAIGTMEKIAAHEKALLHRAFSVFIFNNKGELLLQQRAATKYHCGNLWTNTCCSHPYPNESVSDAANRRLMEEMGFDTKVEKAFTFTYKAVFDNGLTEHEYDHVFVGFYEGEVVPNKDEVMNYSYQSMEKIEKELSNFPEKFTPWFIIAFPKLKQWMQQNNFIP